LPRERLPIFQQPKQFQAGLSRSEHSCLLPNIYQQPKLNFLKISSLPLRGRPRNRPCNPLFRPIPPTRLRYFSPPQPTSRPKNNPNRHPPTPPHHTHDRFSRRRRMCLAVRNTLAARPSPPPGRPTSPERDALRRGPIELGGLRCLILHAGEEIVRLLSGSRVHVYGCWGFR